MKTMTKLAIFAVAIFFLNACASHENFVQKYNSWIGKDINTFIIAACICIFRCIR